MYKGLVSFVATLKISIEVIDKREVMDKGIHIGSWGQLQGPISPSLDAMVLNCSVEWKIDHDDPLDTHRHLSHLIGLYPGYALSSYDGTSNYSKVRF